VFKLEEQCAVFPMSYPDFLEAETSLPEGALRDRLRCARLLFRDQLCETYGVTALIDLIEKSNGA